MPDIDVPDQSLRDWDRIQEANERSRADDEAGPGATPRRAGFAAMNASSQDLFDFGHGMSLEYLP